MHKTKGTTLAREGFWENMRKHKAHIIMCLPVILVLFFFSYVPMSGLVLAFKKLDYSKSIFSSTWCGWDNFRYLFLSGSTFKRITRNTLVYFVIFTLCETVLSVALAIGLDQMANKRLSKLFHSVSVVPIFVSYVAITYIVYAFLSTDLGIANNIIEFFGGKGIRWYMEAKYWPVILTIVKIWNCVGYSSILYYAVITGIDASLYEAAEIDGATKWQQIWRITVPLLMPTVTIMLLLSVGYIMHSDTGLFYQVTKNSGTLYETTQVLDSYVLNSITKSSDFGATAAATFYQSVVGLVLLLISNGIVKKIAPENSLL